MTTPLEVRFLPARQGDAVWIRWGDGHQIMIDMGTEEVGELIAQRLSELPRAQRRFDLLVVTHVDGDHIGGVLTCLAERDPAVPGLTFDDVWFNGWEHLHGQILPARDVGSSLEGMGPAQGERLATWLRKQPWNEAFGRGPVVRHGSDLDRIQLPDGLSLTVLGPTMTRLEQLQGTWKEEVEIALARGTLRLARPGLESYGSSTPPVLEDAVDLQELASGASVRDPSKSNGTSISLLLEWGGRTILLTGDAYAEDVAEGLGLMPGGLPVPVDVFKLPHHGSKNNVSTQVVEAVDCPTWVFSSDGTQFRHPDAVAIARVLTARRRADPSLAFNVPSTYNGWWDNGDWQAMFGYTVEFGTSTHGLVLTLEQRSD